MLQTSQFLGISKYKGVTIVQFLEQYILETETISEITQTLRALTDQVKRPLVLLDFAKVSRFGSVGLGMVVWLHQELRNHDGHLCLANIAPQIMDGFRITRLERILNIAQTTVDGVNLLNALALGEPARCRPAASCHGSGFVNSYQSRELTRPVPRHA